MCKNMYLFVYLNIFTFGFKYFTTVDVDVNSPFFLFSFARARPAGACAPLSLTGVTTKTLSPAERRSLSEHSLTTAAPLISRAHAEDYGDSAVHSAVATAVSSSVEAGPRPASRGEHVMVSVSTESVSRGLLILPKIDLATW